MVNYATDLQYLYQSNDARKVYNVDNLLFQIISETGFDDNVNINSYLKNVNTIEIFREDSEKVRKYIGIVLPGEAPTETEPESPALTQNYDFNDDAMSNDVFIKINRTDVLSPATYQKIVNEITTTNVTSETVVTDHTQFRNYLLDNIEDVTRFMFDEARKKLGTFIYGLPDDDSRQAVYSPVMFLYNMRSVARLISELRTSCISAFKNILNTSAAMNSNYLTDFKVGGFTTKFYYNLRLAMLDKLDVKNIYNVIDQNEVLYFKKIAIDLFLKSAFPLVHMMLQQAMLEWYASLGDYVNVRVVVLAMSYYVFYTMKRIYNLASTMPVSNGQLTSTQSRDFNTLFSKLITYISNNNKIDVTSNTNANEEMKKLIIGLHDLSRTVTDQNSDIQKLKESIKNNQLAMRNVLFNIEVKRKERSWASFEFWLTLGIVIVFTVVNATLLVLNLPQFVFYSAGFVGIAAITYLLVVIAIVFIKGK